jgi:diadenosine tetraphosphate (Ap4A) HIT family hydrolase
MEPFRLHPQLEADCHPVGDLKLSRVLLLDDCRYPWVVLVPRRSGVREIFELAPGDRRDLLEESCRVGEFMMAAFAGDKLNIGALGNLVPQLHLHHVVRHRDDPAWPGPVWGHAPRQAYAPQALRDRISLLREGLEMGVG